MLKKLFYLLITASLVCTNISCSKNDDVDSSSSGGTGTSGVDPMCGSYNGHTLYMGPQGGCYYYNSNGNKTYVDRSYCHC